MTTPDESPLKGRTCADRISSYPSECILEKCSAYEVCCAELLRAAHDIDRIKKHPSHPRVMAGKKWGERP